MLVEGLGEMKRTGTASLLTLCLLAFSAFTAQSGRSDDAIPAPTDSPTPILSSDPSASPSATATILSISQRSVATTAIPALIDAPVPKVLTPSIIDAPLDRPTPYVDRCHTQQDQTASKSACVYGNLKSKTTIVLFGDSHALSWFPAIEKLAIAKNWRMYSWTMSSCWPADIPAWNSTKSILMTNCAIWRANIVKKIIALKPKMVFVAGTRGFATIDSDGNILQGEVRASTWVAGMKRTVESLKKSTAKLIYIADTPLSIFDPHVCMTAHLSSLKACSTPYVKAVSSAWLGLEHQVAADENISWVDPTTWICSTDPCSPVKGHDMIYVDGGHLTATFAKTLEPALWAQVSK